jgi:hypothetical protein
VGGIYISRAEREAFRPISKVQKRTWDASSALVRRLLLYLLYQDYQTSHGPLSNMQPYTNNGPVNTDVDFDTSRVKGKTAVVTGGTLKHIQAMPRR